MTVLNNIASGFSRTTLNDNFDIIEDELTNKVLKRLPVEGEDNSMQVDLDMNGSRILNLPFPQSGNDVARLIDVQDNSALFRETQLTVSLLPPSGIPKEGEQWVMIGNVTSNGVVVPPLAGI